MTDRSYWVRVVGSSADLAPAYIESVLESDLPNGHVTVQRLCDACAGVGKMHDANANMTGCAKEDEVNRGV